MTAYIVATITLACIAVTWALIEGSKALERHGRAASGRMTPEARDVARAERALPDFRKTYRPEQDC